MSCNPLDTPLHRRAFLGRAALGAAGLVFLPRLSPVFAQEAGGKLAKGKVEHVIVLFMQGGPSQIDTFDPKPGTQVGGPTKAIDTAVPGLRFCEHLPQLAKEAGSLSVIRSMNTKEGNHRRASYMMRTGHAPAGPVQHPGFGAIVSRNIGRKDFDLPNFVSVGSPSVGGGFLGVEYSPFVVGDPRKPVANLNHPESVDSDRFRRRWKLLAAAEKRFAKGRRADMVEGHRKIYEQAESFMHSPRAKAFALDKEPEAIRKAYGDTRFGQGCLMARRLLEVGVPYVEVTLGGWDTHRNNFETVKTLCGQLDPAFSQLIRDLKSKGLYDKTLVIWTGDFGRSPKINGNEGRGHFPRAWSTVLSGGAVGQGVLLGDTGKLGKEAKGRNVSAGDLYATTASLLGIDGTRENISKAGRPITVVDKKGSVIKEIL